MKLSCNGIICLYVSQLITVTMCWTADYRCWYQARPDKQTSKLFILHAIQFACWLLRIAFWCHCWWNIRSRLYYCLPRAERQFAYGIPTTPRSSFSSSLFRRRRWRGFSCTQLRNTRKNDIICPETATEFKLINFKRSAFRILKWIISIENIFFR